MTDPAIEHREALDAGAHVGDRGMSGTVTLLTRSGPITISMKRAVMEQLCRCLERELNENPMPNSDKNREIS
jgi:hypothetical protein